jgi:hypothetical protein
VVSKHLNKSGFLPRHGLSSTAFGALKIEIASPTLILLTMKIFLLTLNSALDAIKTNRDFVPNSTLSFSTTEGCTSQENVCLEDDEIQHDTTIPTSMDGAYSQGGASDATLADFLKRPIQIHQHSWDVNSDADFVIDPWSLYLNDSKVTQKIDNYNLLRCNIHVKVVINGNAFYYGDLLVSYLPTPDGDPYTDVDGLIYYTQRPNFSISPTKSEGGNITLPFFQPYNWYSIPARDWQGAGQLRFTSFMPLRNANASNAPVTITVFAWAENVNLSIPTNAVSGSLVPSSTENPSIISDTATAIADGLDTMTPVLGGPATVASKVARGIGSVAKAFGFDRVNPQSVDTRVVNSYLSNTASTTLFEHISKLSIDPKQELSVSSSTVGIDEPDRLVIADQCKQDALLFQFPITVSQTSGEQIAAMRVMPALSTVTPSTTSGRGERGRMINQTPLCHASQPFVYWKGSIKFKFRIMKSTFHKFRLKVVYDPNPGLSGYTNPDLNTTYSRVIDCSTTEEFTQHVTWGQTKPYLRVPDVIHNTRNNSSGYPNLAWHVGSDSGVTSTTYDANTDNGMLYIYILNELVTPNPTATGNPIVNVYVSSDDMSFNVCDSGKIGKAAFFAKPGDLYSPASTYIDPLEPMEENEVDPMGGSVKSDDTLTFFGQRPMSWRALFKRGFPLEYHLDAATLDSQSSVALGTSFGYISTFPAYSGYDPTGMGSIILPSGASHPYNDAKATILNWVAPMFCAWRGSFRVKTISSFTTSSREPTQWAFHAFRTEPDVGRTNAHGLNLSTNELGREVALYNSPMFDGAIITPGDKQPVLEVETPFLSNRRFNDPRFKQVNQGKAVDEGGYIYLFQRMLCKTAPTLWDSPEPTNQFKASCSTLNYGSTGPDFSLFWRISTFPIYDRELQVLA